MRKPTNEKIERNALRLLAVVSLAGTLTAFGCTTNRMPGNGQPAEQTPAVGPANTSSTPGSSSGTTNPPMASDAIVDPTRPAAVDAQATLAADQGYQGRVLGAVSPPLTTQGNAPTAPTGQFANPALIVNPQSTVNSSVSSAVMAPGITGGPVGGGVGVAGAPTALTTVPMSGDATNGTGTSAAAMNSAISTTSNATLATPSNSAIATPALATAPAATSTTARATTTSTTVKATTKPKSAKRTVKAPTTKATAAATTAQPVQIQTTATGDVVMTNTTTNPPQHQ